MDMDPVDVGQNRRMVNYQPSASYGLGFRQFQNTNVDASIGDYEGAIQLAADNFQATYNKLYPNSKLSTRFNINERV